jgi:hypothetical protein
MKNASRFRNLNAEFAGPWQEQMGLALHTPDLMPTGIRYCEELPPRFAAYYTYLKALPRCVRKALQRHWRLPLAGVALMLALGQNPALAATIPVGGNCTLVDAITAANTDTATGGCPAGNGADTIVLPAGSTQTLTEVNNFTPYEPYGATGLPIISSSITIEGNGSTIMRGSGAPKFRIMHVNSTGDLTLRDTTISGGRSPDIFFGRLSGAGVANYGGNVTVINSTITGNSADSDLGGGVWNDSYSTLTVTNSTITGNFAGYIGGGVFNERYSTLIVTNSIISGNSTNVNGGGLSNHGTLTVINSTITGNFTNGGGGGVANDLDGTIIITNSTISGNDAPLGGGLHNFSRVVTVLNSTITSNSAFYFFGGGVANNGTLTLTIALLLVIPL